MVIRAELRSEVSMGGFGAFDKASAAHHSRMIGIAHNILKPDGILVYKTTDFVVNGRQEWISDYAIKEARASGFDLIDKFILVNTRRLMRRHSNQAFATKNHAFFFVFRKRAESR